MTWRKVKAQLGFRFSLQNPKAIARRPLTRASGGSPSIRDVPSLTLKVPECHLAGPASQRGEPGTGTPAPRNPGVGLQTPGPTLRLAPIGKYWAGEMERAAHPQGRSSASALPDPAPGVAGAAAAAQRAHSPRGRGWAAAWGPASPPLGLSACAGRTARLPGLVSACGARAQRWGRGAGPRVHGGSQVVGGAHRAGWGAGPSAPEGEGDCGSGAEAGIAGLGAQGGHWRSASREKLQLWPGRRGRRC